MQLQICKSCWSKDTWKLAPKWKTIQLLLMQLKSANPADLKIHKNEDQNGNHSVALIRKEWHFVLINHEGKHKFRLLGMSHWPDSLKLGELTRCFHSWIFCALVAVVACYVLSPNIVEPFEYVFPNVPHAITKNSQKITSVGSSMLSNTWCWAFVVTLRAAEWITSSVGSFMCLQMAWCWTFFVTGGSWMVHHQCGFFCVSLNGLILNSCSHTGSNWMVCHQCGFFHVLLKYLILSICSHTGSSWIVFLQCEFFHVSSNHLTLSICSHTESSWIVFLQCGFFHVSSNGPTVCICSHTGSSYMVSHQCEFFHVSSMHLMLSICIHTESSRMV